MLSNNWGGHTQAPVALTLKSTGNGVGQMQKKYRGTVLFLGTWATNGEGHEQAKEVWADISGRLAKLKEEGAEAGDPRVAALIAETRAKASREGP